MFGLHTMNGLPASKSFSAVERCSCLSLKDASQSDMECANLLHGANDAQELTDRPLAAYAKISTTNKPSTVRSTKKDGFSFSSTKSAKSVYRSASSDSLLSYYLDGHWPRLMNGTATVAARYEQDSQSCKAAAVPNASSSFEIPKLLINFQEDEIEMEDNIQLSDCYNIKDLENVADSMSSSLIRANCELDDLCNEEIFSIVQTKPPTDFRDEIATCVEGHRAPVEHLLADDGSCGDIDSLSRVPYFHRISDAEDAPDTDAEDEQAEGCGTPDWNTSGGGPAECCDELGFNTSGGEEDECGVEQTECCNTRILNIPVNEQADCCGTLKLGSPATEQAEFWCSLESTSPGNEKYKCNAPGSLSSWSCDSQCRPDPEGCESHLFSFIEKFAAKGSSIPSPNSAFCKPLRNIPSGLQL